MLMWTKPGAYTHIQKQAACHWVRPHHFPPQYHHIPPHSHSCRQRESHTTDQDHTTPHHSSIPQDFSSLRPLASAPATARFSGRYSRQSLQMTPDHQHTLLLKITHAIIVSMWTSTKQPQLQFSCWACPYNPMTTQLSVMLYSYMVSLFHLFMHECFRKE